MNRPTTLTIIFGGTLDERHRLAILAEAGIDDDRPPTLRGKFEYEGGNFEPSLGWIERHRAEIAPLVLRHVDLSDYSVDGLTRDGDLRPPHPSETRLCTLHFSLRTGQKSREDGSPGEIGVLDLAMTSTFCSQLFISIASANREVGEQIDPPTAVVASGSVQYTFGGGLFVSGMGLLVACSAGLVGAPVVGPVAGATMAALGIYDLALGWRKQIAVTRKANADGRKADAESKLAELEVKLKEIELEKARLLTEADVSFDPRYGPVRRFHPHSSAEQLNLVPDSAEVSRQLVRKTAEEMSMDETYANHLLNRCLAEFRILKQKLAGATISFTHKKGLSRRG